MDQLYEDKLEDLLAFISHVIQTISEATHGNGKIDIYSTRLISELLLYRVYSFQVDQSCADSSTATH